MNDIDENQNEQQTTVDELSIDPELLAAIKQQVLEDLKREQQSEQEQTEKRREEERKAHEEYVARMKQSTDPWVEIVGWAEDATGVRVELDWNDAFVETLKQHNITGADEEQIVQKWLIMVLRDIEESKQDEGEYQ